MATKTNTPSDSDWLALRHELIIAAKRERIPLDAEDCAQDLLARLHRRIQDGLDRFPDNPGGWARVAVGRRAMDYRRGRARRARAQGAYYHEPREPQSTPLGVLLEAEWQRIETELLAEGQDPEPGTVEEAMYQMGFLEFPEQSEGWQGVLDSLPIPGAVALPPKPRKAKKTNGVSEAEPAFDLGDLADA